MRALGLVLALIGALAAPAAALAQLPLPPLPPPVGQPPAQPPPGSRPNPNQPAAAPGPVSQAPGSVTEHVDVAQTGLFPTEDLVPPLVRRWSVAGVASRILAGDGRVYLFSGRGLVALDQRDGRQLWSAPAQPPDGEHAAYDNGILFVAGFDDLHAFRASDGAQLWTRHLDQTIEAGAPVASGGAVYVSDERGKRLHAFRASDGQPLWTVTTVDGVEGPALDSGRIYAGGTCGNAEALDRASGARAWLFSTGCGAGHAGVTAALTGGRLWVGEPRSSGGNPILDAATGGVTGAFDGALPVFVDGLAIQSDPTDGVRALDAATGAVKWRKRQSFEQPIAIGHDVYGIRGSGIDTRVTALDPETGGQIWDDGVVKPVAPVSFTDPTVLGAAPGLLIFAAQGHVTAYASALAPAPRDIAIGSDIRDAVAGGRFLLVGVLGGDLRAARPPVSLRDAGWHRGRFGGIGSVNPARDGGFAANVTIFRNRRFRVDAGGAQSNTITVYASPRVKLGRPRGTPRSAVLVARVSAPRARLGGKTFVLYYQRRGRGRLIRLGAGRLSGRARARVSVRFHPPRHARRSDLVWFCVKGSLRMGLGRPSPLTRRCGARVLRRP